MNRLYYIGAINGLAIFFLLLTAISPVLFALYWIGKWSCQLWLAYGRHYTYSQLDDDQSSREIVADGAAGSNHLH